MPACSKETWIKVHGERWVCDAKQCTHYLEGGGCSLGKVSLTCDNNDCRWNKQLAPGIYGCMSMDIHLSAGGKCLGFDLKVTTTRDGDILIGKV